MMATPDQITSLRVLINEPTTATYTDEQLSAMIDEAAGNLQAVAADVWTAKAASYSELVDVQEGNSNRKLSQLQTQALKMAAQFASDDPVVPAGRFSRTRQIERP